MGLLDFIKSLFGSSDSKEQEVVISEPQKDIESTLVTAKTPETASINPLKNLTMKTSELMMKFLKEQGLMPETLDDGNIVFKYQMRTFMYVENDEDAGFFQLLMPGIFDVTDDNREAALVAANNVTSRVKVAKAIVTDDDICLVTESLLDSTPILEDFVPRCLNILMAAQQEFYSQIN